MPIIKIINQQLGVDCAPGLSILNNFLTQEVPIHTVCGGKGACGCCRVQIVGVTKGSSPLREVERVRLTDGLVDQGWRLACQTYTLRDLDIYLPTAKELDSHCSENNQPLDPSNFQKI